MTYRYRPLLSAVTVLTAPPVSPSPPVSPFPSSSPGFLLLGGSHSRIPPTLECSSPVADAAPPSSWRISLSGALSPTILVHDSSREPRPPRPSPDTLVRSQDPPRPFKASHRASNGVEGIARPKRRFDQRQSAPAHEKLWLAAARRNALYFPAAISERSPTLGSSDSLTFPLAAVRYSLPCSACSATRFSIERTPSQSFYGSFTIPPHHSSPVYSGTAPTPRRRANTAARYTYVPFVYAPLLLARIFLPTAFRLSSLSRRRR